MTNIESKFLASVMVIYNVLAIYMINILSVLL